MDFASRTVGMTSLMGRYDNIMKFFTRVQNIACCASDLGPDMLRLELLRLRLSRWGDAVGLSGNFANLQGLGARAESRRYISHAKETLDVIATRFEAVAKTVRNRKDEHEIAKVPSNDSADREILIQRLRSYSNSRLCNSNTLLKARWLLKFDRFCHRSFRRQCQLSMAQDKWIVHVCDDLDKLTKDLTVFVKSLELGLESMCPNSHARISPSCDLEAQQLLRHNPLSPAQLSLLEDATTFWDVPLEKAILREESAATAKIQSNDKGTAGSSLQFNKNNRF